MSTTPADSHRMMDFARIWSQYGGGEAEDIMVQFGLSEKQYFERIMELLRKSSKDFGVDPYKSIRSTALTRLRQQSRLEETNPAR